MSKLNNNESYIRESIRIIGENAIKHGVKYDDIKPKEALNKTKTSALAMGRAVIAHELGIVPQSVWQWESAGRLPWSEIQGKTNYCDLLVKLGCGKVSKKKLIACFNISV